MNRRNFLKLTLAVAGVGVVLPRATALTSSPTKVAALDEYGFPLQAWVLGPHQIIEGDPRPRLVGQLYFEAVENCPISRIVMWHKGTEYVLHNRPLYMVAGDSLTVEE